MTEKKDVVALRLGKLSDAFYQRIEDDQTTPAKLLKAALMNYLNQDESQHKDITLAVGKSRLDGKLKAVQISLGESEMAALDKLADHVVTPTYQAMIIGILRAFFAGTAIYTLEELKALKQANVLMQNIGRNLNQIARDLRHGNTAEFDESILKELAKEYTSFSKKQQNLINQASVRTRFEI